MTRTAAIQRTLLPMLLEEFADAPEPDRGLLNYRHVSDKLGSTPWYLRLLRDGGPVARRLARVLSLSRYATDLLTRDPEALRLLADDSRAAAPQPRKSLIDGFAAAADRYAGRPGPGDRRRPGAAAAASCSGWPAPTSSAGPATWPRRHPLDVDAIGIALSDVTDATLGAALRDRPARSTPGPAGLRFAVIGMGRLGGYEMSYPSDADVLFVYAPPRRADGDAAAAAHAIAEELRRLLASPAPDPPLGVDADLRPEGRQGPLVRSLNAYQQYYARWSKVWESQALLRARFVCGDRDLGLEFERAGRRRCATRSGGLTREQVIEIRRIKARVETERLPRGADPNTHTKLGRGGLADVEWAVQLMQLRHAYAAARAAPDPDDRGADRRMRGRADRQGRRGGDDRRLDAGGPGPQRADAGPRPRRPTNCRGTASSWRASVQLLGGGDPGEFVDRYLRLTRRSRAAMERVLDS